MICGRMKYLLYRIVVFYSTKVPSTCFFCICPCICIRVNICISYLSTQLVKSMIEAMKNKPRESHGEPKKTWRKPATLAFLHVVPVKRRVLLAFTQFSLVHPGFPLVLPGFILISACVHPVCFLGFSWVCPVFFWVHPNFSLCTSCVHPVCFLGLS